MVVGKFFKNINQKNKNHYFSGLSFNSKKVKKKIFFLQLEELKLMLIDISKKQLKKAQLQLFPI